MDDVQENSPSTLPDLIKLTVEIVGAYVSNNSVPASELPALLSAIHGTIGGLRGPAIQLQKAARLTPGQVRKSITPEALISFEDGKPYKTLRRHLTKLGVTPEQYREKWGLPPDYPLVAASYSKTRSAMAKSSGLGQQRRNAAPKVVEPISATARDQDPETQSEHPAAPADKAVRSRKPEQSDAAVDQ